MSSILDDIENNSDDNSNEKFYQNPLYKKDPVKYAEMTFKLSGFSDITEESNESLISKLSGNRTFKTLENENQNKKNIVKDSTKNSTLLNNIFPEVKPESKVVLTNDDDDDLFGLKQSRFTKLTYATPDTLSLTESQLHDSESEIKKLNKSTTKMKEDIFGLNRPRTGKLMSSTPDIISLADSKKPKTVSKEAKKIMKNNTESITDVVNYGKGDWLGLKSVEKQLPKKEQTAAERTVSEKNRWDKVLENELMAEDLNYVSSIHMTSSVLSYDLTSPQNNAELQGLEELKERSSNSRTEVERVFTPSNIDKIDTESQTEDSAKIKKGENEEHCNKYQTKLASSSQKKPDSHVSQGNMEDNVLPSSSKTDPNIHEFSAISNSKKTVSQNKKHSNASQSVNRHKLKLMTYQNNADYSSESTINSTTTISTTKTEERHEHQQYFYIGQLRQDERKSKSRTKPKFEKNKIYHAQKHLKYEENYMQCNEYLKMASTITALELEKGRLEKLISKLRTDTEREVEIMQISQQ